MMHKYKYLIIININLSQLIAAIEKFKHNWIA